MSPGDVLGDAWQLYKRHWRHLLPIALAVYVLLTLFVLLLVALFGWFGVIAGVFVRIAGVFWLQGALVIAVEDIRDGRADLSMRDTLARVRPTMNTLAVAGILAAIGISIGLVLLIVPGLLLATWWLLIVPAIVLERRSTFEAFGRSRDLVRGSGWTVFGLIVLTFVVLLGAGIALGIVLGLALSPLPDALQQYLGDVISNTLLTPFIALAFTLAYYRLREVREAPVSTVADSLGDAGYDRPAGGV
ncbi:MAG TPA: hypothetical protein VHF67_02780 [Gaiellaceae bacterium]|jgi:hypothetical protein|nr:hypothetical protein [Gaiellaceae bacterium]